MDESERAELAKLIKSKASLTLIVGALGFVALISLYYYEHVFGNYVRWQDSSFIGMLCLACFCTMFGWMLGLMEVKRKLGDDT